MAWAARIHSKGHINRCGRALVELDPNDPVRDDAINVVDNWRSCHAYPLQVVKMTLLRRAKKIYPKALIAQRLKRRPSIEIKLRDNPNMELSQMQDIGGCRAVMLNVKQVTELVNKYKEFHSKSPKNRSDWDGSDDFDYVLRPKADGYRSVHLVFRFCSDSPERALYNGQRIEIQIRSKLQHSWATAVETAQVFTGQALKSRVKNAAEDWLRFFALTSSAFALREKSPTVPNTPNTRKEIVEELKQLPPALGS
jgi:ppGpp synthetase/RelA/SpoT-type nucleotidyltranferase